MGRFDRKITVKPEPNDASSAIVRLGQEKWFVPRIPFWPMGAQLELGELATETGDGLDESAMAKAALKMFGVFRKILPPDLLDTVTNAQMKTIMEGLKNLDSGDDLGK